MLMVVEGKEASQALEEIGEEDGLISCFSHLKEKV